MSTIRNIRPNLKVVTSDDAYEEDFQDRAEVMLGGHSDSFYLRPEEDDRCYLPSSELAWLLRADHILECMAKCGIHNTDEYEAAMRLHRETYE